jgi:transketolase N-terminal domain/subunit
MIAPHGQGYLGQALGAAEIVSVLDNVVLRGGAATPTSQRDKILISPGHYVVCAYAALATRGELSDSELATYGNDCSRLEAVGTLGLFPEDWGGELCDLGLRVVRGQKVPAVSNPSRIEFLSRANIDKLYPQDKA